MKIKTKHVYGTCTSFKVYMAVPSLVIAAYIQVLQHDQRLISVGKSSQACGDPTLLVRGIVLVPVGLHLVGPDLTYVGPVGVPAAWVLGVLRKLDMFDDHRRPLASLQVQLDDLSIAAPQSLDLCAHLKGRSPACLQYDILVLLLHFHSGLQRKSIFRSLV